MTPEMQLAQTLGSLPTRKEKLAARMEELSVEELEAELRRGKEKVALGALAKPPAPAANMARPMARPGGVAAKPSMLPPTPVAPVAPQMPGLMKGASAKEKMADAMGRKLARAHLEKTALMAGGMPMLGQAIRGVMKAPVWQGAAAGAALGAGRYMTSNDPNRTFLGSVAGGAALGAGAHAGLKAGIPAAMRRAGQPGVVGAAGTQMRAANRAAVAARHAPASAPAPAPAAAPTAAAQRQAQVRAAAQPAALPAGAPAHWRAAAPTAAPQQAVTLTPTAPATSTPSMSASGVREGGRKDLHGNQPKSERGRKPILLTQPAVPAMQNVPGMPRVM